MTFFSIADASRKIAAKKLSPVELTNECLERIDQFDPKINAFITVTRESALSEARAAEERIMASGPRTPLDGIPIAHKDLFDTKGILTTAHSRILRNNIPSEDSVVVAKLKKAGAVTLGKLATLEFALAGPSFDLPWPPARNPWNTEHFTGGSSSGTAAAVAASFILGGTGTDTGGSIRGPAAFCGISGIKPTYGRCSRRGVFPLAHTLDTTGPMAWTAEDCAMLLQQMAAYDQYDPSSANVLVPDFGCFLGKSLRGLRIGVARKFYEEDNAISNEAHQAIENSLAILRSDGATICDVELSHLQVFSTTNRIIMNCEAAAIHETWLRTRSNEYGKLMRHRLIVASMIGSTTYIQAQSRRRRLCWEMEKVMGGVDILITAITASEASPIAEIPAWDGFEKPSFATPWNLTGYPAMSTCVGFGIKGLPLALQIGGRAFDEATVLQVAHALERATPWRQRRPELTRML